MTTILSDVSARLAEVEARVAQLEPAVQALVPEAGRFARLRREADALVARHSDPDRPPPLFGLLVGVKDIFHVDGWPTRAGSRLPPDVLAGPEADVVSRLKRAGALVLGKTVTTEFAHFAPGPTRNPRNLAHTPGGSSSGSAAAVAAGYCEAALGTQTIGSVIRPASFCGVVGLKPTFARVPTDGVVPLAPSFDQVGWLAADVDTARRLARGLCADWAEALPPASAPVLGVPEGPYLNRASGDTLGWFEQVCRALGLAGYILRPVPVMADFEEVLGRHYTVVAAEAARVHHQWFAEHGHLYSAHMSDLVRRGQRVSDGELETARAECLAFRVSMRQVMAESGIDLWVCPSAVGPAPQGLDSTGDPVMNLPWTQAGLPVISLPAGVRPNGLPMGLQLVGAWYGDEVLLGFAEGIEEVLQQVRSC